TEMFDGKPHYVLRIDENILSRSPLVRWCIADPSRTLPGLQSGEAEICVDRATETRGTYLFVAPEIRNEPKVTQVSGPFDCAVQRLGTSGLPSSVEPVEYLRRAAARVAAFNPETDALPP